MEDSTFSVIALVFVFLIPVIGYTRKCILNYSLFKKVGWIIAPFRARNLPSRDMTSLLEVIIYKQQDLKIPKEFRLKDDKTEIKYTEEILEVFKQHISKQYFGGYLSNSQKIRNLHEDWYFMYRLFVFCEEYSDYNNNYKFHDKIYKYKSTDGSYHTHSLTDYGTTLYKLYLISLLYVENNPYTCKLYEYIDPKLKEHLKSYLEKNEVVFWTYRP